MRKTEYYFLFQDSTFSFSVGSRGLLRESHILYVEKGIARPGSIIKLHSRLMLVLSKLYISVNSMMTIRKTFSYTIFSGAKNSGQQQKSFRFTLSLFTIFSPNAVSSETVSMTDLRKSLSCSNAIVPRCSVIISRGIFPVTGRICHPCLTAYPTHILCGSHGRGIISSPEKGLDSSWTMISRISERLIRYSFIETLFRPTS